MHIPCIYHARKPGRRHAYDHELPPRRRWAAQVREQSLEYRWAQLQRALSLRRRVAIGVARQEDVAEQPLQVVEHLEIQRRYIGLQLGIHGVAGQGCVIARTLGIHNRGAGWVME